MKKEHYFKKLFILCLFLTSFAGYSQVVINEYSAANRAGIQDNFGKTEDWIELYNTTDSEINLEGWKLTDKESKPDKWEIPNGIVIPANGFLRFWCSSRDLVVNDHYHTNFKLTQTKANEVLMLSNPTGSIVDRIPLVLTLVEHSRCRVTDGSDIWATATIPTIGSSNNGTNQIAGYTAQPSMDLDGGFYNGTQTITIVNNEPNSTLRYTLDGTAPTPSSPEYVDPIMVTATQVVKARSFSDDPNIWPGKISFNTYFIDESFSLAVFSVAADSMIDLANGNGPIRPIGSLEYFDESGERQATSYGELNRHGQDSWVLDHRSIDWISRDEMGYSKDVNAKLFSYSERDGYQRFMFRASGDDNYPARQDGILDEAHTGSTHVRDEYVHALAHEGGMKLDVRAVERVVVFYNGQYWGVYGLRERPVDHDYTEEYYDQGKYDIQYLTTWGTTEAEYGGQQAFDDWVEIRDFILDNDMGDSTNYQVVKDNIQVLSLIDYMILNLNTVAADWLNYNTGWWRGLNPEGDHKKWGYIVWDLDATFDYYINYTDIPNRNPDAQPCDIDDISLSMDAFFNGPGGGGGTVTNPEDCFTIQNGSSPYPATDSIFIQVVSGDQFCCDNDWDGQCQAAYDAIVANGGPTPGGGGGGGDPNNPAPVSGNFGQHEKIFLKLQDESPEFKQLYYGRQADLMNTVFSCENMTSLLDRMIAKIEPEMPRQIQRWGGSMTEWQSNVASLRQYIEARCELLDDGMTECFDVTGPNEVTLLVSPDGVGEIDFNTLDIEEFPWTGNYFGGMENKIKAKAFEDDWEFLHWESRSGNVIFPDSLSRRATITLTQADTLIAVFGNPVSTLELDEGLSFSAYPTAVRNSVNVEFELNETLPVSLNMYSAIGVKVADFPTINGRTSAGTYSYKLEIDNSIAAGLYFLRFTAGNKQGTVKILVIE